jgi:mRNA-degrading endonuclease RelE of RelBE toxin-antitoxin system|tara:strand:- start:669 stop:965 length:297 start_codon:yes stop_codon:yes gene_type:complete
MGNQSKAVMKDLKREIAHDFKDYNKDLLDNLKKNTPVGTSGKARQGWKNKYNNEIGKKSKYNLVENKVPYIGVLDTGSSNQAPNGIVKPALTKTKQGK